ncbi:MAG: hypothetical protein KBT11_03680, partial [Treponema sp.]|nr:hypothetical protein [Candidatus Treponema equifaecale]
MNNEEINIELTKAESHLKRATLDCYKYGCVSLGDFYNNFRKEYHFADLTVIDNGDFLAAITKNFADGRNLLHEAKKSEIKKENSEIIYKNFESAFDLLLKN